MHSRDNHVKRTFCFFRNLVYLWSTWHYRTPALRTKSQRWKFCFYSASGNDELEPNVWILFPIFDYCIHSGGWSAAAGQYWQFITPVSACWRPRRRPTGTGCTGPAAPGGSWDQTAADDKYRIYLSDKLSVSLLQTLQSLILSTFCVVKLSTNMFAPTLWTKRISVIFCVFTNIVRTDRGSGKLSRHV